MSRLGTRLVLLSAIILIALLSGLFVLAESGYARLSTLNVRISDVQERQTRLARLLSYVIDGESSMRGYVLTADEQFLEPLLLAQDGAALMLDELTKNYGRSDIANEPELADLRRLVSECFDQLQHAISLHGSQGQAAAAEFIRMASGKRTTDSIRVKIRALEDQTTHALLDVFTRWLDDLKTLRLGMAVAVLLNMILILVAATLMYREMRRRESLNLELQQEVRARSAELAALSSHLQQVSEREKKALARDLHDALGGLLVGTKMDVAWIRNRIGSTDPAVEMRFQRIQKSLEQGVDFKRRVVEQLRPTLLDNMGLFAALRWQFQDVCNRASLECNHVLPEPELVLTSDAAIALFRVAQEALTNMLKHANASAAWLEVEVEREELQVLVADNGRGMAAHAQTGGGQGLAGMRHRVMALGGTIEIRPRAAGGTEIVVRVPLTRILASARDADNTEAAPAETPIARTT